MRCIQWSKYQWDSPKCLYIPQKFVPLVCLNWPRVSRSSRLTPQSQLAQVASSDCLCFCVVCVSEKLKWSCLWKSALKRQWSTCLVRLFRIVDYWLYRVIESTWISYQEPTWACRFDWKHSSYPAWGAVGQWSWDDNHHHQSCRGVRHQLCRHRGDNRHCMKIRRLVVYF